MEFKLVSGFWLLLLCLCVSNAKIVYLNGTEVFNGKLKSSNITTITPLKWFNPRNISNHSGLKTVTVAVNRKNDAEEETRVDAEDQRPAGPLATRDTTMLSSIRGIWSDLSPILTVLSTILGIFLMFVIIESPLSPLPVPPLPYSPVGPYPPTNMYPFGIPPPRSHYDVGYIGPQSHASYRIPRHMKRINRTIGEAMDTFEREMAKQTFGLQTQDLLATIRNMWQPALEKCMKMLTDRLSRYASGNNLKAPKQEMPKEQEKAS